MPCMAAMPAHRACRDEVQDVLAFVCGFEAGRESPWFVRTVLGALSVSWLVSH